jgi:hypothetical protein
MRFELIFASLWLAFGLFVLPAVIYAVGSALMGPYGEDQGVGSFYANFFRDLAEPSGRTWTIALGPLVLISAMRAIFIGVKPHPSATDDAPHNPPPAPQEAQRVEPRVSLD